MRTSLLVSTLLLALLGTAAPARAQASEPEVPAAVRAFAASGDARVIRKPGSLTFPYGGRERVVLTCAPLRTCKVLLNADEQYLAHVAGDTERWFIQETLGPAGVSLVVVKPYECNITTDLTITTTRRIYDLIADAPRCDEEQAGYNPDLAWTPLVEFYDPQDVISQAPDAEERLRRSAATQPTGAAAPAARSSAASVAVRAADPAMLHFAYRWQRDQRYPWVPEQVYDDGYHTYIRLPAAARRHEQPILFELAPDGSMQMVNYLVTPMDAGDVYTVDRVLERGVLVVGDAKRRGAQRLLIIRDRG